VVGESASSPSDVSSPVTAIAAEIPGGISIESTRPSKNCFRPIGAGAGDDLLGDSPPMSVFPVVIADAALGGISTTMTSWDGSTADDDFGDVVGFSGSSTL